MCYLCVARGVVGPNYDATQKIIARALAIWKRRPGGCGDGDRPRLNHDLTTVPRNRTWDKSQLKLWAVSRV